jgi:hypothetical protein
MNFDLAELNSADLSHAVETAAYPVRAIAAQHGSIIPEHLVDSMIDTLRHLDCGILLLTQPRRSG